MNPICRALESNDTRLLYQALRYCYARYTFCLREIVYIINKLLRNEGFGRLENADTPSELLERLEEIITNRVEEENKDVSTAVVSETVMNYIANILSMALMVFADKTGIRCPEAGRR